MTQDLLREAFLLIGEQAVINRVLEREKSELQDELAELKGKALINDLVNQTFEDVENNVSPQ